MMSDGESIEANRRPLKTRQWGVFRWLADRLARAGVTPNVISSLSVFCALIAALAFAVTNETTGLWQRFVWLAAAAGIQGRLIANLLDGMVAVEGGKRSAVGELFNEVPDRISDPLILVGAGYAMGSHPAWGWGAAVVALFVAYVRALGASVGAGQIFIGPMAKQQRMALLTIVALFHAVVPAAWPSALAETGWGVMRMALALICLGGVVTAVRRLRRIAVFLKQSTPEDA